MDSKGNLRKTVALNFCIGNWELPLVSHQRQFPIPNTKKVYKGEVQYSKKKTKKKLFQTDNKTIISTQNQFPIAMDA